VAQGLRVVPKHIFENEDPVTFSNYDLERGLPLGTGAYRLVRATQTELVWDRQDSYWGSETGFTNLPAPRRVIIVRPGTEEAASAMLRQNELDTSTTVSVQTFASMAPDNAQLTGWYAEAPYAWFDPCSRGFWFNTTIAPWDDVEMRYAINYLINRDQVVAIAYGGNSLPAKAPFPAYGGLNEFVASAESAGLFDKYPVGTYNPDQAAQILESKGYILGGDGYYAKDGQPLTMDIVTANYPEIVAIGQVVAEQLQQAGINASSRVMDAGVYSAEVSNGNLTTWIGWDMCGSVTEPYSSLNNLNNELLAPIGERANGNYGRWDNEEYSDIVDEMGALGLDDPKRQELGLQAFEIYLRELPNIPVTQAIKVIAFNTTYWTNWPSADNNYIQPPTWWMSFHTILHHLEPAQASN
jgi:peptide/nickel transport system substrate-binding protein